MAAAGKFKAEVRSNARQVLAVTRENGKLLPAALVAAMTNVALAGVEQANKNGIVTGHEGKEGSWWAEPIAGATDPTALPTRWDSKNGQAGYVYTRNAKGHILDRKLVREATANAAYLFRDRVVSRTGEFADDLDFDLAPGVRGMQLDGATLREEYLLESNLGGLKIAAVGSEVLLMTSSSDEGNKVAVLEKRGTRNGKGPPRYIIRRALKSVANRYSTAMRKELALAAKLAAKAKAGTA